MAGVVGVAISAPIAAGWPRRSGRSGRCATRSWCSWSPRSWRSGCRRRVDSSQGEEPSASSAGQSPTTARPARGSAPAAGADPGVDGLRAARELRAALAVGLPHAVHGVPAARAPDPGDSPQFLLAAVIGAAGARQRRRHRRRLAAEAASTPRSRWSLALLADAAAVIFAALIYGLFAAGRARLHRRAGAVPGQAVARLDDPARRARAGAHAAPSPAATPRCQLAWVIGGFVGIAMPLQPARSASAVAAVVLVAWSVFVLAQPGPSRRAPVAAPVAGRRAR